MFQSFLVIFIFLAVYAAAVGILWLIARSASFSALKKFEKWKSANDKNSL